MELSKKLKEINPNLEIVERFLGGMSNLTYLVKDIEGNKYVYRYPGKGNYNFVDYKIEKEHLKIIEKLNISNETIYQDETGIKLATYVEGKNIDENVNLDEIVKVLKTLHDSDVKLQPYNHLQRLEKYEQLHKNKSDIYEDLKKKWTIIFDKYLKEHVKYPCHNDAQFANFISNEKEVRLLDWEYAGMNDYIYDIACFGNVDFTFAEKLLKVYKKNKEDNENYLLRIYAWRMFQCLQWYNVASYKDEIGLGVDLNIDFKAVSQKYENLADTFYNKILTIKKELD